jgi:hypothetical protein
MFGTTSLATVLLEASVAYCGSGIRGSVFRLGSKASVTWADQHARIG